MKTLFHFGILAALLILATPDFALAKLGDHVKDAVNDKALVSQGQLTTDQSSSCYHVVHIDSDGAHIAEYVNVATDQVFMVATISRLRVNLNLLLSDSDFNEIKNAPKTIKAPLSKTHNHQSISSETARLKTHTSQINNIHRNVLILKTAVPACVSNPESLL